MKVSNFLLKVNVTIFVFFISFVNVYAQFTLVSLPSNCTFSTFLVIICSTPVNTSIFSYSVPGSYTLTIPLFVTKINYIVYGGGGGGGGSSGSGEGWAGGGGGSGAYTTSWNGRNVISPLEPLTVTPLEVVSIVVGAGGLPGYWILNNTYKIGPSGTTGTPNGGNGYTSSISGSFGSVLAAGGVGGHGNTNNINDAYSGAGGTPNGIAGGVLYQASDTGGHRTYAPTIGGNVSDTSASIIVGNVNHCFPSPLNCNYGDGGYSNGIGAYNYWTNTLGYLSIPGPGYNGAVFITYENAVPPTVHIFFSDLFNSFINSIFLVKNKIFFL